MKGFYISVSNGLVEGNHRKRMGSAVWEFMWLLDKITSITEDGIGFVLGGKPIKLKEIADDQGVTYNNISKNLLKLEREKYINIKHASYGLIITVNKTKKIFGGSTKTVNHTKDRTTQNSEPPKQNDDPIYIDNTVDNTNIYTKNSLNSKKVGSNSDYRSTHSKSSQKINLEPLPYEKLWEIAMKKNVSLADTKKIHQSIFDSIENGDKYKVKNISLTLQKWIDLGIGRGNIQNLEEIGRMILEDQSPEKVAEHKLYAEAAAYLNLLPNT